MALNFPSSPTNGQQYTDANAVIWEFDGVKWNVITGTANKMFSGVKLALSTAYSLTSTSSAVTWDVESIDTDSYFSASNATKVSISKTAFYRVNFSVYTGSAGSSYTIAIKKNGSTTLSTATISTNQFTNYDEIIELNSGDYLEIYASETGAVGTLTTSTSLEITRLGLSMGTAVSSADAFSGARAILTGTYSTTSTSTAIAWNSTAFNQNANAAGSLYWSAGSATRLTVSLTGYYRVKGIVATGALDTYNAVLKKNGSTTLTTASISANGSAQLDEIYQLTANDYLELFIKDQSATGSLTINTYLEIVRIGV